MNKSKRKKSPRKANSGKRSSFKSGLPPGVLLHIGRVWSEDVLVNLISYNDKEIREKITTDLSLLSKLPADMYHWIEVTGLHEPKVIEEIGKIFDIHPLLLEDILNTEQRPKSEDFVGYLFLTLKSLDYKVSGGDKTLETEQVSMILGKNYLISFKEADNKMLEPVKELLRQSRGKIRQKGPDYLMFTLTDIIVDKFYSILESINDSLDNLEEAIFENPVEELLGENQQIKRDILQLRKTIVPLREALHKLELFDSDLIDDKTNKYFSDVYDHTAQILENIETFREINSELKDIYLSSISYRMNQVMKVLTIVATVFIPLTFIVGVYGMNFEYMPEIHWKYAYPAVWLIMASSAVGMLIYFRIKKWF